MKRLDNYINEVLVHGNFGKNLIHYTCQPETKKELREIIIKRIKDEGYECDLNDIDVINITDMSDLFNGNPSLKGDMLFQNFNCDISKWDVSNVTNMSLMFAFCKDFNCDISKWDVSSVENMMGTFDYCESFDQDLSKWNVNNVTEHAYVFTCSGIKEEYKPKFK